jgi:hypothetical protein
LKYLKLSSWKKTMTLKLPLTGQRIRLTKTLVVRGGKFKEGMEFDVFDHVDIGTPDERFFFRVPKHLDKWDSMAYLHEVELLDKDEPG